MFEPTRGGTRGGQAEFKWTDVSADKDREHYLGHSVNAPTGRWQKSKDIHWYSRDKDPSQDEKDAEFARIKQLEADALSVALGFEPAPKDANAASSSLAGGQPKSNTDDQTPNNTGEKEERRRRKAERKEEKKVKKLAKLERKTRERGDDSTDIYHQRSERNRSRSRSPRRRPSDPKPPPDREPHRLQHRVGNDYDVEERERERERDRRRWEMNTRRERPASYR